MIKLQCVTCWMYFGRVPRFKQVVKVTLHKAASPPQTDSSLAPPGEYDWTCASFGPLESTTQIANRSIQPFLHSSRQKVSILYNQRSFSQKLPLLTVDMDPILHDSLGPSEPTTGWAVFAQMTAEYPYTSQWDAPFSLIIALYHGGIWTI